jgi:hypothetical protein
VMLLAHAGHPNGRGCHSCGDRLKIVGFFRRKTVSPPDFAACGRGRTSPAKFVRIKKRRFLPADIIAVRKQ